MQSKVVLLNLPYCNSFCIGGDAEERLELSLDLECLLFLCSGAPVLIYTHTPSMDKTNECAVYSSRRSLRNDRRGFPSIRSMQEIRFRAV